MSEITVSPKPAHAAKPSTRGNGAQKSRTALSLAQRGEAASKPVSTSPSVTANYLEAANEYAQDFLQRSLLFTDIMRERGNQYVEHLAKKEPHVLMFNFEPVMSGSDLARPTNYGLVRIIPPEGIETDPRKRPFVVIDPRAGHGPGIGGFKPESEIGMALSAGHPCYFIGFLPNPVAGQTVEDVMRSEAAFLERVIALHPESDGKPVVIGNCQAGWQVLMTAAVRPELFGPIIVAGAPLSYWAGWQGKYPMRYSGGLLGGSWLTALTSDLGAGQFDGAWLVENFESLNPANTLWTKQYNVFSKVDTERQRYLDFERYWGGHVFLNDVEMQYIVDNLFVGNKLATAELVTSDGIRIDLRNIRSPILCFCSEGDNITPPPQALGWITDLYRSDEDVRAHDQTIIYSVHDSIGHLGIFVSGRVGRKEHHEFATNIELLDALPPGIYQAEIQEKGPNTPNPDLIVGDYLLSLERRSVDDVRRIVMPDVESDRRFAAVARLSEANLSLYRSFVQPWVRAAVSPQTAEWLARLHPLRLSYEMLSDRNPWMGWLAGAAQTARENRKEVSAENPFLQGQGKFSQAIEASLDQFRLWRDSNYEKTFELIYGSPWVQALAGLNTSENRNPRGHPGETPEHKAYMAAEVERLRNEITRGGLLEAGVRAIYYIVNLRGTIDERAFNVIRGLCKHCLGTSELTPDELKSVVRTQFNIMRLDSRSAIAVLPELLSRAELHGLDMWEKMIARLATAGGPLDRLGQARLKEIEAMYSDAARKARSKGRVARGQQASQV